MTAFRHFPAALLLLAILLPTSVSVRAAQGYDNCSGFIDALPATISTQGTWCMRHDLATSLTSGSAITITTNNVTIDCNDFKLGGLGAGATTLAYGIYANGRLNTTVRHCNVRGFFVGVNLATPSGGNVVEDNRFDGNTVYGMSIAGDGSVVQRNMISDTGGSESVVGVGYGIATLYGVDVRDNTISGISAITNGGGAASALGIYSGGNAGGSISGNRIRGLSAQGSGTYFAIYTTGESNVSFIGNNLVGADAASSIGLRCTDASSRATDNIINGFATPILSCRDDGNSL